MAKKLAIPEDRREWPDYEYRPFPRWLGRDRLGADLIVHSDAEVEEKTPLVVYPMDLGYNEHGKVIQSMHPDETLMKKQQVVKPLEPVAEAEAPAVGDTKPKGKRAA